MYRNIILYLSILYVQPYPLSSRPIVCLSHTLLSLFTRPFVCWSQTLIVLYLVFFTLCVLVSDPNCFISGVFDTLSVGLRPYLFYIWCFWPFVCWSRTLIVLYLVCLSTFVSYYPIVLYNPLFVELVPSQKRPRHYGVGNTDPGLVTSTQMWQS